jgi:hypothetical protein
MEEERIAEAEVSTQPDNGSRKALYRRLLSDPNKAVSDKIKKYSFKAFEDRLLTDPETQTKLANFLMSQGEVSDPDDFQMRFLQVDAPVAPPKPVSPVPLVTAPPKAQSVSDVARGMVMNLPPEKQQMARQDAQDRRDEGRGWWEKTKDLGKQAGAAFDNMYSKIVQGERLLAAKQRSLLTFGEGEKEAKENEEKVKQSVMRWNSALDEKLQKEREIYNIEPSVYQAVKRGDWNRVPEATISTILDAGMQILPAMWTGGYSMFAQTLPSEYAQGVEEIAKQTNRTPEQVIADGDDAQVIAYLSAGVQGLIEKFEGGVISKAIKTKGGYKWLRDNVLKGLGNKSWQRAARGGLATTGVGIYEGAIELAQEATSMGAQAAAPSENLDQFSQNVDRIFSSPEGQERLKESFVGGIVGGTGLVAGGRLLNRAFGGGKKDDGEGQQPPPQPPTQAKKQIATGDVITLSDGRKATVDYVSWDGRMLVKPFPVIRMDSNGNPKTELEKPIIVDAQGNLSFESTVDTQEAKPNSPTELGGIPTQPADPNDPNFEPETPVTASTIDDDVQKYQLSGSVSGIINSIKTGDYTEYSATEAINQDATFISKIIENAKRDGLSYEQVQKKIANYISSSGNNSPLWNARSRFIDAIFTFAKDRLNGDTEFTFKELNDHFRKPVANSANQTEYVTATDEELQAFKQGQVDPERLAGVQEDANAVRNGEMTLEEIEDPNYRTMVSLTLQQAPQQAASETVNLENKVKETENKIKNKNLFLAEVDENGNRVIDNQTGEASQSVGELISQSNEHLKKELNELKNKNPNNPRIAELEQEISNTNPVPTSVQEINGIEFVQFSNPKTGDVDVIVTGKNDGSYVGYYRLYVDGKPTNQWSSKFENPSRNKEDFKTMISGVQSMLPEGHEYTEKTSISTDGLRVWNQQLNRGYQLQYDGNGNLLTNRVAINGDAIVNELGIDVDKGSFENISVRTNADIKKVKQALLPYLQKLGLNESNLYFENGTVYIDLPVLKKQTNETPTQSPSPDATGTELPVGEAGVQADVSEPVIGADEGDVVSMEGTEDPIEAKLRQMVEESQQQEVTEEEGQVVVDEETTPNLNQEEGVVAEGREPNVQVFTGKPQKFYGETTVPAVNKSAKKFKIQDVRMPVVYLRSGALPRDEQGNVTTSFGYKNGQKMQAEEGVSVYEAAYDEDSDTYIIKGLQNETAYGRPLYLIDGKEIDRGTDFEPVLDPSSVKVVGEIPASKVVIDDEIYDEIDFEGNPKEYRVSDQRILQEIDKNIEKAEKERQDFIDQAKEIGADPTQGVARRDAEIARLKQERDDFVKSEAQPVASEEVVAEPLPETQQEVGEVEGTAKENNSTHPLFRDVDYPNSTEVEDKFLEIAKRDEKTKEAIDAGVKNGLSEIDAAYEYLSKYVANRIGGGVNRFEQIKRESVRQVVEGRKQPPTPQPSPDQTKARQEKEGVPETEKGDESFEAKHGVSMDAFSKELAIQSEYSNWGALEKTAEKLKLDESAVEDYVKEFLKSELPSKLPTKNEKLDADYLPKTEVNVRPIPVKTKQEKDITKILGKYVSKDEMRPAMQSVYFDADSKKQVITDGWKIIQISDPSIKETKLVNPKTGKIVDERFPEYKNAIPDESWFGIKEKVNVDDLASVANGAQRAAKFFDLRGSDDNRIATTFKFGDSIFYLNSSLLLDILNAYKQRGIDNIEILFNAPNKAILFKGGDVDALLMPVMGDSASWGDGELTNVRYLSRSLTKPEIEAKRKAEIKKKLADIEYHKGKLETTVIKTFDHEYHAKRIKEIETDVETLENPIQELDDIQTVKTAIENGEITEEQATEFITSDVERGGEVESIVEGAEAESGGQGVEEITPESPNQTKTPQTTPSLLTAFEQKGDAGRKARAALKSEVGPEKFDVIEQVAKNAEKILRGLEKRGVLKIECP